MSLFSGYGGLDHGLLSVVEGEVVAVADVDPGACAARRLDQGPRKKRTPAVCITADAMRGGGGTIDMNSTVRTGPDQANAGSR